MTGKNIEIILIGGSSGSIPVIIKIINGLPIGFPIPIVIIVHRMKNIDSQLKTMLSTTKKIWEPEDKEPIIPGGIYLAPQNYHLLAEEDRTFSMDYSEPVNYSRPSIDVTFMSFSDVYKKGVLGILLSGANKDGAEGIHNIIMNGGMGIAQDPASAENPVMPDAAIAADIATMALTPENITKTILNLLS